MQEYNLTAEQDIILNEYIDKYNNELKELKTFILENNLENNIIGKVTKGKTKPHNIIALKMFIIDSTPLNIPKSSFLHLSLHELRIISMFWLKSTTNFTRDGFIQFIQNE